MAEVTQTASANKITDPPTLAGPKQIGAARGRSPVFERAMHSAMRGECSTRDFVDAVLLLPRAR